MIVITKAGTQPEPDVWTNFQDRLSPYLGIFLQSSSLPTRWTYTLEQAGWRFTTVKSVPWCIVYHFLLFLKGMEKQTRSKAWNNNLNTVLLVTTSHHWLPERSLEKHLALKNVLLSWSAGYSGSHRAFLISDLHYFPQQLKVSGVYLDTWWWDPCIDITEGSFETLWLKLFFGQVHDRCSLVQQLSAYTVTWTNNNRVRKIPGKPRFFSHSLAPAATWTEAFYRRLKLFW